MGRWRYLNILILLACAVFLYLGLFTARSPLVPKPMGAVVRAERALGPWAARLGHDAVLAPGTRAVVQIRFCPRCYREIRRAGVAVAASRPAGLDAPGVGAVQGDPHRRAAATRVPDTPAASDLWLWLGAQARDGTMYWARWPLRLRRSPQ